MTKIFRDDDYDNNPPPANVFGGGDDLIGGLLKPSSPRPRGWLARLLFSIDEAGEVKQHGKSQAAINNDTNEARRQAHHRLTQGVLADFCEQLARWLTSRTTVHRLFRKKTRDEAVESCFSDQADFLKRIEEDDRYTPEQREQLKSLQQASHDQTVQAIATDEVLRRTGLDPSGQ